MSSFPVTIFLISVPPFPPSPTCRHHGPVPTSGIFPNRLYLSLLHSVWNLFFPGAPDLDLKSKSPDLDTKGHHIIEDFSDYAI